MSAKDRGSRQGVSPSGHPSKRPAPTFTYGELAFYVDGSEQEFADEHDLTLLDIVTEEWMRPEVGLTLVSIPGEKCLNSDSEVHAKVGRIVGARVIDA